MKKNIIIITTILILMSIQTFANVECFDINDTEKNIHYYNGYKHNGVCVYESEYINPCVNFCKIVVKENLDNYEEKFYVEQEMMKDDMVEKIALVRQTQLSFWSGINNITLSNDIPKKVRANVNMIDFELDWMHFRSKIGKTGSYFIIEKDGTWYCESIEDKGKKKITSNGREYSVDYEGFTKNNCSKIYKDEM